VTPRGRRRSKLLKTAGAALLVVTAAALVVTGLYALLVLPIWLALYAVWRRGSGPSMYPTRSLLVLEPEPDDDPAR
jgi:hypothetical protein